MLKIYVMSNFPSYYVFSITIYYVPISICANIHVHVFHFMLSNTIMFP